MRILHVVNHTYRYNGNVHAAVDLACAEADLGHDVTVCSSGGSFDDVLRAHGVTIELLPKLDGLFSAGRAGLAIRRLLERRRIDIVHAHMMKSAVLCWAASRLHRAGLVTTVHNAFQRSAIVMTLGDRVIAVSKAVGKAMHQRGVPLRRLRVVLNGTVGSARHPPDPPRAETLARPAVLYVGGLHPRKGLPELLSGFAMARRSRPDLHLYLVGEGPCEQAYVESVAVADRPNVHFCGSRPDPRGFMLGADVLVLPSRADPAPLVLSEAREAGLAVIATRVDGIPELLEDGQAGLLVEPQDPAVIAVALLEVLSDSGTLQAHRARSQINLEHMSLRRVANETLAVYDEIHRRPEATSAMKLAATPIRFSAWLAIGFGVVELAIKIVRAVHHPPWPAFAAYDYVPNLFLLSGGPFILKYNKMDRLLVTGWAITFADYYHSFFIHLENLSAERNAGLASIDGPSVATGAFLVIAVVGLAAALWPTPRVALQR